MTSVNSKGDATPSIPLVEPNMTMDKPEFEKHENDLLEAAHAQRQQEPEQQISTEKCLHANKSDSTPQVERPKLSTENLQTQQANIPQSPSIHTELRHTSRDLEATDSFISQNLRQNPLQMASDSAPSPADNTDKANEDRSTLSDGCGSKSVSSLVVEPPLSPAQSSMESFHINTSHEVAKKSVSKGSQNFSNMYRDNILGDRFFKAALSGIGTERDGSLPAHGKRSYRKATAYLFNNPEVAHHDESDSESAESFSSYGRSPIKIRWDDASSRGEAAKQPPPSTPAAIRSEGSSKAADLTLKPKPTVQGNEKKLTVESITFVVGLASGLIIAFLCVVFHTVITNPFNQATGVLISLQLIAGALDTFYKGKRERVVGMMVGIAALAIFQLSVGVYARMYLDRRG